MNIAIDIGNTFVKIGYFESNELIDNKVFRVEEIDWKSIFMGENLSVIVSASGSITAEMRKNLDSINGSVHLFTHNSKMPISIEYETPKTLGLDRIAGGVGANVLFPESKVLVIDAGTAITYDFMDGNVFKGGNISPGLSLRYKSLNYYTAQLPLGTPPSDFMIYGKNTNDAIGRGVYNGLLYEIEETIHKFKEVEENISVVLTGGESHFFVNKIKRTIFAKPNLVLIGLNRILTYNA
ncbi:MAG: type III pantothenate kinase [Salinivirgaceae bacterium]|nr:type III pantothenate kinase [Salinivirgaceae bacterium]MDD4745851.1 type III pantothenate kinase [Salinivirgaceae bacterium]MDY0281269.1 type III pantothenate kinase [Salinivirgaceae bacterium]